MQERPWRARAFFVLSRARRSTTTKTLPGEVEIRNAAAIREDQRAAPVRGGKEIRGLLLQGANVGDDVLNLCLGKALLGESMGLALGNELFQVGVALALDRG